MAGESYCLGVNRWGERMLVSLANTEAGGILCDSTSCHVAQVVCLPDIDVGGMLWAGLLHTMWALLLPGGQ